VTAVWLIERCSAKGDSKTFAPDGHAGELLQISLVRDFVVLVALIRLQLAELDVGILGERTIPYDPRSPDQRSTRRAGRDHLSCRGPLSVAGGAHRQSR